jgi:hypothetical protein
MTRKKVAHNFADDHGVENQTLATCWSGRTRKQRKCEGRKGERKRTAKEGRKGKERRKEGASKKEGRKEKVNQLPKRKYEVRMGEEGKGGRGGGGEPNRDKGRIGPRLNLDPS